MRKKRFFWLPESAGVRAGLSRVFVGSYDGVLKDAQLMHRFLGGSTDAQIPRRLESMPWF